MPAPLPERGGARGLGTPHVERRRPRRVAVGAERLGIERIAEAAAAPVDRGLDADLVLARTRRAAIAEEVVALRVRLDPRRRLVERGRDLRPILVEDRSVAADGRQLALVDLGA